MLLYKKLLLMTFGTTLVLYSLWYHHTYRWLSCAHLCTGWPPVGAMIPEAVQYNSDFLMMSTWCSKHVEA